MIKVEKHSVQTESVQTPKVVDFVVDNNLLIKWKNNVSEIMYSRSFLNIIYFFYISTKLFILMKLIRQQWLLWCYDSHIMLTAVYYFFIIALIIIKNNLHIAYMWKIKTLAGRSLAH